MTRLVSGVEGSGWAGDVVLFIRSPVPAFAGLNSGRKRSGWAGPCLGEQHRMRSFYNPLKERAMNQISDIMTRDVQCVAPNDTLQRAAKAMGDLDVGSLPVWDGQNLVGMVTDRDITIRGVAEGKKVDSAQVSEVMSTNVQACFEDDQIDEVMEKMQDSQIRRVPVMNRQNQLIGIVSLGDLATKTAAEDDVQDTLETVSQPSEPNRSSMH
jgi:CBS domain-containing protein